MPIRHLLELQAEGAAFGPDDIKAIIAGYEAVLTLFRYLDWGFGNQKGHGGLTVIYLQT